MPDFFLSLFGNLMAAEVGALCRGLAQKIICATAQKLPDPLKSRMREEWSALLEDVPGDLSKLWMAISLYRKHSVLEDEAAIPIGEPCEFHVSTLSRIIKRFVDILVSMSALLVMFPLMLFVAFLIKIDSPGPVFERQMRVGLYGRVFLIRKFRTRTPYGENSQLVRDKLLTPSFSRIGWFLQKTLIDYFPMFINVLRGEMSLVGPHPERPVDVEVLQREIPYYHLRHIVRPGMTGWAQVKLDYVADIEAAQMNLQYDLYYVRQLSFWVDMRLLAETIFRL